METNPCSPCMKDIIADSVSVSCKVRASSSARQLSSLCCCRPLLLSTLAVFRTSVATHVRVLALHRECGSDAFCTLQRYLQALKHSTYHYLSYEQLMAVSCRHVSIVWAAEALGHLPGSWIPIRLMPYYAVTGWRGSRSHQAGGRGCCNEACRNSAVR